MSSPTQRSLKLLRDAGYFCQIVERWNPHAKVRQDLFGFIDVLAIRGDQILAVQTTSGSNVAARITKIRELPGFHAWLYHGAGPRLVHVHGWSKRGPRGKRKTWTCRIVALDPVGEAELESYD